VILVICFLLFPIVSAQSDADKYIKAANDFMNRDDFQSAAFFYSKANSVDEGNYENLLKEAILYYSIKDYQKAMDSVNKSLKINDNRAYPYLLLSRYAITGFNDSLKRDEYLKMAASREMVNEADTYSRSLAQFFLGDRDEARTTLQNGTEKFNKSSAILNYLALTENADGNYDSAIKVYDNLINISSSRMKATFIGEKAKIQALNGLKPAIEILNISNQTESLYPGYSVRLEPYIGSAYTQEGDFKNASLYFMTKNNANYGNLTFSDLLRAEYLYKIGDLEQANKILLNVHDMAEKSIKDPFGYPNAVILLDRSELDLYMSAMDKKAGKDALFYAKRLIQRNPENQIYLKALADCQNLTKLNAG
jgi:tetratricopeptide (TPR) repeat protein